MEKLDTYCKQRILMLGRLVLVRMVRISRIHIPTLAGDFILKQC